MVKGFGGVVQVKGERIIIWKIEDYYGVIYTINIKTALYAPEAPSFYLSLQQWSHQANENDPKPYSTWCATNAHDCTLYWNQER